MYLTLGQGRPPVPERPAAAPGERFGGAVIHGVAAGAVAASAAGDAGYTGAEVHPVQGLRVG